MAQSEYMLSNAWSDEQRRLAAIEELFDQVPFEDSRPPFALGHRRVVK